VPASAPFAAADYRPFALYFPVALRHHAPPGALIGQIGGGGRAIVVAGGTAYVGVGQTLWTVDVGDPRAPRQVGQSAPLGALIDDIAIYAPGGTARYAYVVTVDERMHVLDVSDARSPRSARLAIPITPYSGVQERLKVIVDGPFAYAGGSPIVVFDLANPASPRPIAEVPGRGDRPTRAPLIAGYDVADGFAYVADLGASGIGVDRTSLRVFDVRDPHRPRETYRMARTWNQGDRVLLIASGGRVYLNASSDVWEIIDVRDPARPRALSVMTGHRARGIVVRGQRMYYASTRLHIVDISNPARPVERTTYDLLGGPMATDGRHLYLLSSGLTLQVLDVATPDAPVNVGGMDTPARIVRHVARGRFIYAAEDSGRLEAVDIGDPSRPRITAVIPFRPSDFRMDDLPSFRSPYGLQVDGDRLYVARAWAGVQGFSLADPAGPARIGAFTPTDGTRFDQGLAVREGVGYAGFMDRSGTGSVKVIDFRDPVRPRQIATIADVGTVAMLGLNGDLLYIVADGNLLLFDVSDPAHPRGIGNSRGRPWGLYRAVMARGGFVFAFGFDGRGTALRVIDAADPANMRQVGHLSLYVPTDLALDGGLAYISLDSGNGVRVVDVRDPYRPRHVAAYADDPVASSAYDITLTDGLIWVNTWDHGLVALGR